MDLGSVTSEIFQWEMRQKVHGDKGTISCCNHLVLRRGNWKIKVLSNVTVFPWSLPREQVELLFTVPVTWRCGPTWFFTKNDNNNTPWSGYYIKALFSTFFFFFHCANSFYYLQIPLITVIVVRN